MNYISLDCNKATQFFSPDEFDAALERADKARSVLLKGTGAGNDFIGWVNLPTSYDKEEFARIKEAAKRIRKDSEALVVIGIGGSYLGARAAIEFLRHSFYNEGDNARKIHGAPEIFFVGNQLSGTYMTDLIEALRGKDFSVNVISKSGTTTESSIAFRIFREILETKYGKEGAAKRIYATTDKKKGALKSLSDVQGYETFVVPDDVGGRYSVLTAVGLLPIAVSGVDIDELMSGAAEEMQRLKDTDGKDNEALTYAAMRNVFLDQGKSVELMANYEPGLHYVAEWWKQLFGESEGKDKKGLFPASVDLTTDLHSMGQYIQDGQRIMFETVLCVDEPGSQVEIPEDEEDLDGLNYLAGKTMDFVNKNAMYATVLAHTEGGVPNLIVHMKDTGEKSLGALFYFFEFACGVSGYMLGVNPFDQPGVESYKKNMFALLGKPGYEELGEELRKKL